jgi:hypothetical protein
MLNKSNNFFDDRITANLLGTNAQKMSSLKGKIKETIK